MRQPSLQWRLMVEPIMQAAAELSWQVLVFAVWLASFIAAVIWQWRHGAAASLQACTQAGAPGGTC